MELAVRQIEQGGSRAELDHAAQLLRDLASRGAEVTPALTRTLLGALRGGAPFSVAEALLGAASLSDLALREILDCVRPLSPREKGRKEALWAEIILHPRASLELWREAALLAPRSTRQTVERALAQIPDVLEDRMLRSRLARSRHPEVLRRVARVAEPRMFRSVLLRLAGGQPGVAAQVLEQAHPEQLSTLKAQDWVSLLASAQADLRLSALRRSTGEDPERAPSRCGARR